MPYGTRVPPDTVPDAMPLSTREITEFNGLVFRNWGAIAELTAERAQLADAYAQLAHVRWLRDVRLP